MRTEHGELALLIVYGSDQSPGLQGLCQAIGLCIMAPLTSY